MNFTAAADFIQSLDQLGTPQHLHAYHFEHGIARARHLLDRLGGAPHATTRCVLVAGSKGKGSTVAMLSSILAATGYRVGAFTGPHLHTPLERFAIHLATESTEGERDRKLKDFSFDLCDLCGAIPMPEQAFVEFAERIRVIVNTWDRPDLGPPTRFEAFTAMAYRWFEEQQVDVAVMEIGIGGRLDAVNLAEPLLSIITNISLEHTQMLGNTLSEIAREKAGIMRVGRPVVIAHQANEAMAVLCDEATRINAQPVIAESGWHCEPSQHALGREGSGQWFAVSLRYHDHAPFFVPLLGAVQLQNAAAVLAACDALERVGLHIDEPAIRAGLAQTRWRGRFELLGFDPLVIADGAHTPYSMQQLCASLHDYFPNQRIHFIVGILRDKDGRGMLEAIARTAASVTLCDMPVRRATPAEQLHTLWNELPMPHVKPLLAANLRDAMQCVHTLASPDDVICITGSLHLVAAAVEEVTGN